MLDLVDECGKDLKKCGYVTEDLGKYNTTCSKLFIDTDGKSKRVGFVKGHYYILTAPLVLGLPEEHFNFLKVEIKKRIKLLFKLNKIDKNKNFLFVGIGNPKILSDSFGSKVIDKIEIKPFKEENNIFKISPNTFSNTGINAYEIVKLLVEAFDISVVVLFDALVTTNLTRLGTSLQFNDAGLTPGSAVNKFGMAINQETLGVPCLSIGAPFMISAGDISKNCSRELILAEKDVEEKVEYLSRLIAEIFNEILNS